MSDDSTPPPSAPRRRGRTVARALVVLLGVVAISGDLWLPLVVHDALESELRDATGAQARIETVSGGWFTTLVLRDVTVDALPSDGAVASVTADTVELEDWKRLLWDEPGADAPRIRVAGVVVDLRATADDPEAGADAWIDDVDTALASLPSSVPPFELTGRVTREGAPLADRVTVRRAKPGAVEVAIERLHAPEWGVFGVQANVDLTRPGVDLRVEQLADQGQAVLQVDARWSREDDVSLTEGRAAWRVGGSARGSLSWSGPARRLEVTLGELDLATLPPPLLPLLGDARAGSDSGLAGRVTATLLVVDADSVSGRVQVDELRVRGRSVPRAEFEVVRASAREVRLSTARLTGDWGAIECAAVGLALSDAPTLAVEGGRLTTRDGARTFAELMGTDAPQEVPQGAWTVDVATARLLLDEITSWSAEGVVWTSARPNSAGSTVQATASGRVEANGKSRWEAAADVTADLTDVAAHLPSLELEADLAGTVRGTVSARDDGALGGSLALTGTELTARDERIQTLELRGTWLGRAFELERLSASGRGVDLHVSGVVDLDAASITDADVRAEVDDLAAISRWSDALPRWTGRLAAQGRLTAALGDGATGEERLRSASGQGAIELTGEGITWNDVSLGALRVQGRLTGRRIDIDQLTAAAEGLDVSLRGHVDEQSWEAQDLVARIRGLSRFAVLLPELGSLDGDVDLEGSGTWTVATRELDATAEVRVERLEYEGATLGGGHLSGRSSAREATLSRLDWRRNDAACAGTALLRWDDDGVDAEFGELRVEAPFDGATRVLSGDGPVRVSWRGERLHLHRSALRSAEGRLAAEGWYAPATPHGSFELTASGAMGLRAFIAEFDGTARFDLSARGTWPAPRFELAVDAPELSHEQGRGRVRAKVRQTTSGLELLDLDVDLGVDGAATGRLQIPWRLEAGEFVAAPGSPLSGRLDVRSENPERLLHAFAPPELELREVTASVRVDGRDLDAEAQVGRAGWRSDLPGALTLDGPSTLRVRTTPDGLQLAMETPDSGPLRIAGNAVVDARPDWTDPGAAADLLTRARLRGRVDLAVPDLSPLTAWVEGLVRVDGSATGNVDLAGTLGAPTWSGHLAADDVGLRLDDVPPLGAGSLRMSFTEDRVTLERLTATLGRAPVEAHGSLTLDASGEPVVDLTLAGTNVLLARSDDLLLRADLDLRVTGPTTAPLLSGRTEITRGLYLRPMSLLRRGASRPGPALELPSLRTAPLADMRLDVTVRADETFRIENDLLDGAFLADLHVGGTGAAPVPTGRIDFRGVAVSLPFSSLVVERGSVVFPVEDPLQPEIDAAGRTRMRGYDLTVLLTGPLDSVDVQVSSSPPLPPEDALLLLTTGTTREELERTGIGRTALGKAGTLLGDAVLSWISGPARPGDESWTDRVKIDFGREQSRSGVTTLDAELRLSERWFLHAERDRYDAVNVGLIWRLSFR